MVKVVTPNRIRIALAIGLLLLATSEARAQRPQTGTVRVVVKDPSGAVIPGAALQLTALEGPMAGTTAVAVLSDGQGVAVAAGLTPGRYKLDVSFAGFEPHVTPELRVRAGDNRREVTLPIRKLDESVAVGRDPATSASDPNSDRFGNVLSKEQIDALPDDPDEMQRVLEEMAGPGGTIRVDGFRGGRRTRRGTAGAGTARDDGRRAQEGA